MTLLAASAAAESIPQAASEPPCYSRLVNDWICPDYWQDRRTEIGDALVQHLQITVLSVALGLVVAGILAAMARRSGLVRGVVLGSSTAIYTIPSLALLPLLVPWTGLSMTTVVIGLAAYAQTILVRAILDGLEAVPVEVREAARGLGYGRMRSLLRVELPLAWPVMSAGLRVATVSTVALTTIGSLVAYGGLGNLISDGVLTNFRAELFTAAVLCVLLAVALDALIVLGTRLVTPWRRA
ncbi:glycine betaine/carnitine/choline/L-proline ABC transporter permease ProW [soil metagenome]